MTSDFTVPKNHTLSAKSYNLRRDTFLFWPRTPAELVFGLNQKLTPVSSAKLHRWIRILDPSSPDFNLRSITIAKFSPFKYIAIPTGPTIPSDSTAPLPPGDYGWFHDVFDPKDYMTQPFYSLAPPSSFEESKKQAEESIHEGRIQDFLKLNVFPPAFEESVLRRDRHRFITGAENASDFGVTWIVPPAFVPMVMYPNEPTRSEVDQFISISNAIVIRKDLMVLFHDNAFGVDVDDDCHIVVFRDIGSVKLPSKIQRDRTSPGPDDRFLREHFRWCLRANLQGGDIGDDFSRSDIQFAGEELGLHGDENELAPLDDPRWQSPIGKEFFEVHLSHLFAY